MAGMHTHSGQARVHQNRRPRIAAGHGPPGRVSSSARQRWWTDHTSSPTLSRYQSATDTGYGTASSGCGAPAGASANGTSAIASSDGYV